MTGLRASSTSSAGSSVPKIPIVRLVPNSLRENLLWFSIKQWKPITTMKKALATLALLILYFHCLSQIIFEKGYFINNQGTKIPSLIKNADWKHNPDQIEYRLGEGSEIKLITVQDVQEFGVGDDAKYVRHEVEIDSSDDRVPFLSLDRKPAWKTETLFLKTLVEGKATLLIYDDDVIQRFFF